MKALTLLAQILLFCLLVGLFYYSFSVETASALTLFVALLIAQLAFLVSRIRPVSAPRPKAQSVADPKRAAQLLKSMQAETAQRQTRVQQAAPAPEPEPVPDEAPSEIDPGVFSRFQQNLDQSAQAPKPRQKQGQPLPSPPEPEGDKQEVVVKLSGKKAPRPRNPYAQAAPTQPETKETEPDPARVKLHENKAGKDQEDNRLLDQIPAEPLGDLFDESEEKDTPKLAKAGKKVAPKPRRPQAETQVSGEPLKSQETLDFSALEEEAKAAEEDMGKLQLKAATSALDKQDYPLALRTAMTWLEKEGRKSKDRKKILAFVEVASKALLAEDRYKEDFQLWQSIFGSVVAKKDPDYLPLLEERIHVYTEKGHAAQAVPFLLTALSAYQAQSDHLRMDQTYQALEEAYREQGNGQALAQCYQSHLGVKKSLKDYAGQLKLLDDLGKLLYDQGDQEGSKRAYEESLVVRGQMQGAKP